MKQNDPCGLCKRTLRVGDSFHEVTVLPDDLGGYEPGRYNDVCGECAGFEYKPPVVVPGEKPKYRGNICSICDRLISGRMGQRLRFMESDEMPFEFGLHALCIDCFEKYKIVVQRRVRKTFSQWQTQSWKAEISQTEPGDKLPTLDQFTEKDYERYTTHIAGIALM